MMRAGLLTLHKVESMCSNKPCVLACSYPCGMCKHQNACVCSWLSQPSVVVAAMRSHDTCWPVHALQHMVAFSPGPCVTSPDSASSTMSVPCCVLTEVHVLSCKYMDLDCSVTWCCTLETRIPGQRQPHLQHSMHAYM